MTDALLYRPAAPPEPERRWGEWRQALRLPVTLRNIYRIVREDFQAGVLDEYLWSFWGFHHEPGDLHHRARPWQKVDLKAIEPGNVRGIARWEMALMLNMAMEDEEPIPDYTRQSGEGFRFLLPALGRFMGKNEEQSRYGAGHGVAWCEGAWCAEERRHSNTLARIIERLMGMPPRRDNPNQPMVVTADDAAAVRHLISRQTTEWNASSSYVVMAAHAEGPLHLVLRNLERDEVKHLCIMSAADTYLFGPRPWRRFVALVKKGLENFTNQKKSRSGGEVFGTNPVTAVEGIASHLLTEYFLRRWLRTIPLLTLTAVFETESAAPRLLAAELPPERQAEIDATLSAERARRVGLERWAPRARQRALDQRQTQDARHQQRHERIRNNWYAAGR
ncbi:MAG: hypothetical protein IPP47_11675 [Bryobacterales bacterium]|nr:hypothetical protein [Bryobacterales bacterium]